MNFPGRIGLPSDRRGPLKLPTVILAGALLLLWLDVVAHTRAPFAPRALSGGAHRDLGTRKTWWRRCIAFTWPTAWTLSSLPTTLSGFGRSGLKTLRELWNEKGYIVSFRGARTAMSESLEVDQLSTWLPEVVGSSFGLGSSPALPRSERRWAKAQVSKGPFEYSIGAKT